MIILGIDPGTARMGWACIEVDKGNAKAIGFNCITTHSAEPPEKRLQKLYSELKYLIRIHKPNAIALEELYFATNAKTVIPVAQARGVVLLAAAENSLPVVSYTPLVVKLTITGSGRAEKIQVQQMVMRLLKLDRPPTPDDTADALAIALTHAYSYKLQGKIL